MEAIDLARDMDLFQEVPGIKSNNMRKAREYTGWGYVHVVFTVEVMLTALRTLAMDYHVYLLLHATTPPAATKLRCTRSRFRPRLVWRSLGSV